MSKLLSFVISGVVALSAGSVYAKGHKIPMPAPPTYYVSGAEAEKELSQHCKGSEGKCKNLVYCEARCGAYSCMNPKVKNACTKWCDRSMSKNCGKAETPGLDDVKSLLDKCEEGRRGCSVEQCNAGCSQLMCGISEEIKVQCMRSCKQPPDCKKAEVGK